MKKRHIIICIAVFVIAALIICVIFVSNLGKKQMIETNYLCEIEFDENIESVLSSHYFSPKLHSCNSRPELYDTYLNDIFAAAKLSEQRIGEIMDSIDNLPDDTYVYISVGKKLNGIFYSERPEEYGWNGIYDEEMTNAVYIYWGTEPLGNVVDGYV